MKLFPEVSTLQSLVAINIVKLEIRLDFQFAT